MQLSITEGKALKEAGIDRVASNNTTFIDLMRAEAMRIANQRGWVSSDDLRVYASQLNLEPTHCNAYGAVFKGPRWKIVGRRKSAVPGNHAREIKIWAYMPLSGT